MNFKWCLLLLVSSWLQIKDDVSDKDNTNQPNSRSQASEDELPGMNRDNMTSDLAEAGEIADQAFSVRRTTERP